jgi:hypothetical protein
MRVTIHAAWYKRNRGVGPDHQLLLAILEAIFLPPEFAARWLHLKVETTPIAQFVGFGAGLGVPDRNIGERHGVGAFFQGAFALPPERPQNG